MPSKPASRRTGSGRPPASTAARPSKASSEAQLNAFLAKYTPEIAAEARAALRKMRGLLPGAVELVYDNYNALAVGFSPTEQTGDAIFSIAVYPRWVSLFFLLNGVRLRDPECFLQGSGNRVRHVVLENPATLDDPAVRDLMEQALELSPKAIDRKQERRLIIKSVSAKQRPRRPGAGER